MSGKTDWYGTTIGVANSTYNLKIIEDNLDRLEDSEDKHFLGYGVGDDTNSRFNLKTISFEDVNLPSTEPITVEYKKIAKVITFKSSTFQYTQTDLPSNIDFSIFISLGGKGMKIKSKLLYLEWSE